MPVTRILQSITTLPTGQAVYTNYQEDETAGGLAFWRKRIYLALGILTFIYLLTTVTLFYLRRHKISDIQYRPLRLNLLNTLATTMLCVMFCFRTGLYPYGFPCFIIHWISYIGFCLYFSALTCRALSLTWIARFNIAKLRMSLHATTPKTPRTPRTPMALEGSELRLMLKLKKFRRYATDEWLTKWIICPVLGFAFICAFTMQILSSHDLSIRPLQKSCRLGPESILLFVIIIVFLIVICPTLYYLLYGIRDAYGLRNELMMKMITGTISFVLFFIWTFSDPKLKLQEYFGASMFSYFSFLACHTWSITLPLWRTYSKPTVTRIFNLKNKGTLKLNKHELFEKVLADIKLFELYKVCATACFCTELVLFLKEFQGLKMLVTQCCTPSNQELLTPKTPKFFVADTGHISFPETPGFLSVRIPPLKPLSPSFMPSTPCTKSIIETVTAASWIPFPHELKSEYATLYDTFLNPDSDLSINISGNLLNRVKTKIEKGQYDISMYENVREEVLNLLYMNTFDRFLRMYGSELKSRKWDLK